MCVYVYTRTHTDAHTHAHTRTTRCPEELKTGREDGEGRRMRETSLGDGYGSSF